MAVCATLGLVVTSSYGDTLCVFDMRSLGVGCRAGLALVCTLGRTAPFEFDFRFPSVSGHMAFTGPASSRFLVVADGGHKAVHVVDVVSRAHVGYVAAPGTLGMPQGVAAKGSLVAVSVWSPIVAREHVVCIFEGSGAMWTPVRNVGADADGFGPQCIHLRCPRGLRFTHVDVDGLGLAVAHCYGNGRGTIFRVDDGSFARTLFLERCPSLHDWMIWRSVTTGGWWLVVGVTPSSFCMVQTERAKQHWAHVAVKTASSFFPTALSFVPGLGLVVRDHGNDHGNEGRLQCFVTPDVLAMASMSRARVAWMVAARRGRVFRDLHDAFFLSAKKKN
jgi:hypothetical protein